MPASIAFMGAIAGFVVGVAMRGNLFGQMSSAGYHRTNGQFASKSSASADQLQFLGVTTAIGFFTGPIIWGFVAANPVLGSIGIFACAYIGLNESIDSWNLF